MISPILKIPEDVTREASTFLQRLLGPVAQAADLLSDKIRVVRFENAIKTIKKAKQICMEENIKPKEVPVNFLVPFLEQVSLQDDSEIQDIWARLLASAVADYDPIINVIKDTLSRLTINEITLLNAVCKQPKVDRSFKDFEGDAEDWLRFQYRNIYDLHEETARNFDRFPSEKIQDKIIDQYFKKIEEFIATPYDWNITGDIPYLWQRRKFVNPEYSSSIHIVRETNIFEMKEASFKLVGGYNKAKMKKYGASFLGPIEDRKFEAKWLQVTPYGLEVFLRCSKN